MGQEFRHDNTSVTLINYHFVWCPRRRRPILTGMIANRTNELIHKACVAIDVKVVALEVMPDHIHAFLNCPPIIAPYQVMHRVKGYTAHSIRSEFPELKQKLPSLWTRSYFCSTAGNVSSETIKRYIAAQKTRG